MDERRQNSRVEAPRVLLRISTVDRLRQHYLKDLSEGGAFIRLSNPMSVGASVLVDLEAPGLGETVRLASKVVRAVRPGEAGPQQPVGMVVKFDNADPAALEKVKRLVDTHLGAGDDEEVRLRGHVQGLVIELGATREAQTAAERRALEAEQRLREQERETAELRVQVDALAKDRGESESASASAEQFEKRWQVAVEELRAKTTECIDLRTELEEMKGNLAAFEEQFQRLEQDEATARTLAEKLAVERKRADRQFKEEAARVNAEAAALRAELEAARAEHALTQKSAGEARQNAQQETERAREQFALALKERLAIDERDQQRIAQERDASRVEAEEQRARAEEATAARREIEEKLAGQGRQIASLARRLDDASKELDRVKKRERDLSRLLAAVSASEPAAADEVVVGPSGAPGPAGDESPAADEMPDMEIVEESAIDDRDPTKD